MYPITKVEMKMKSVIISTNHQKQCFAWRSCEERRRDAVKLMLDGSMRKTRLAESLDVSYTSIKNWWNAFEDSGNSFEALASKKREGRRPGMNRQQLRRLERMLLKGPMEFGFETDLWTTERVADLIEEEFGIHYHLLRTMLVSHSSHSSEGRVRQSERLLKSGTILTGRNYLQMA